MHKTKLGEFKYLVLIVHEKEEDKYSYLFYDKDSEATDWIIIEINKVSKRQHKLIVMSDINHLLDRMIKNKINRTGQALYEIYMENYPDDEQKTRVTEFWNK